MTMPAPGAHASAPMHERLHALDHLRALAMLAGVLFHAALAYSPLLQPFWPAADRQSWRGIDALIWLPHLVRMPVFFLVSGFFTAWLLQHRGMGGLMRHRMRRILVPLLVALPLVYLSIRAATEWAVDAVEHRSAFLEFVRGWLAMPDPPAVPPGTGHLWFLYYLLIFSVLVWTGRTLGFGAVLERTLTRSPRAFALMLPLVLIPGFALTTAPHPAPESLIPQFWAIGIYGAFFALGMTLHQRLDWLLPLRGWLLPGVVVCLALYALFLWRLSIEPPSLAQTTSSWLVAVLEACIAAWGTLVCLVAGLRWLDRANPVLRYLAHAAYWTYLLHLPLLFVIQYALMDLAWDWPWKFLFAVVSTTAACLLSYEFMVRRTALRRFVG